MFKKKQIDNLFKFLDSTWKLNVQVQLIAIDSIAYLKRHLVHLFRNWLVLMGKFPLNFIGSEWQWKRVENVWELDQER